MTKSKNAKLNNGKLSNGKLNKANKQFTLLVMAGGTGGHIFPGLAVADELKSQGWRIHWLGTAERMEAQLVPAHGYDISFINIKGLRNKRVVAWLLLPIQLIKAILQAKQAIKTVKPDVVLGMGGYASAPGGFAAWLMGKPLVIHEQNAAAGLSNRLLARIANKVFSAFPKAFAENIKHEVVGNPLRASIQPATVVCSTVKNNADENETTISFNLLIVGGSLGAQILNEVVPLSIHTLMKENQTSVNIWHQTGKGKKQAVDDAYAALANTDVENKSDSQRNIKITEFIQDMAAAYQWADVVICRAGALTVSELAMAATPAIFVPLPHAVDDHQTKNAQFLVNKGAAKLLPQAQFNPDSLVNMLKALLSDKQILKNMAQAAGNAADKQATQKVASACCELANETYDEK